MRSKKWVVIFALLVVVAFTSAAIAAEPAGIINKSIGEVKITRNGKDLKGDVKFELAEKDVIATGKDSFVEVKMADKSTLRLGGESKIMINIAKVDKDKNNTEVELFNGQVRAKVRHLRRAEDSFKVKTPTAVVAVRGTHFVAGVQKVWVISGKVLLATAVNQVMLNSNQTATVGADGRIGNVAKIPRNDPVRKMNRIPRRKIEGEAPAGAGKAGNVMDNQPKGDLNPVEQAGGGGKVVPPSKVVTPPPAGSTTTTRRSCR